MKPWTIRAVHLPSVVIFLKKKGSPKPQPPQIMQVEEPLPLGCSSRQSLRRMQRHHRTLHLWIIRGLYCDTDMYILMLEPLMYTSEISRALEDFGTFI